VFTVKIAKLGDGSDARPPIVADEVGMVPPDAVRLRGLLGKRIDLMRENRLLHHEDELLLWPFRTPIRAVEDVSELETPELGPDPRFAGLQTGMASSSEPGSPRHRSSRRILGTPRS